MVANVNFLWTIEGERFFDIFERSMGGIMKFGREVCHVV